MYVIGIDSYDYDGWETLQSALCMLKNQEIQWCILKIWELKSQWFRFQSESENLRTTSAGKEDIDVPAQYLGREKDNPLFLYSFVLLSPSTDHTMPTHIGEHNSLYSAHWFKWTVFKDFQINAY